MEGIGRIHVVDDDRASRESTAILLSALGFEVREWDGPQAVLDQARFIPGDFLLVDYRMEGLTGVELLGSLSARGDVLPAVVMSGHIPQLPAGSIPFLQKPFEARELLDAIRRARE
jgi:two-component system response regulator FixJ